MTERTVIKNADGGKFVSKEYAEANPGTTYAQTIAEPDRLDTATDAIVRLTDSRPAWTLHVVPGIEITGDDPRNMLEQALIRVRVIVEPGAESAEQE